MNILNIVPAYIPAYRLGGPIISIHNLTKSLVEKGHNVTVYSTNFDGHSVMDVPLNTACDIDGVKVYYFSINFPFSYFRSKDLKKKIEGNIKKFDCIHIHNIYVYTTLIAAKMAKKFNIPYIISPRGMLDKEAIQLKGTLKKRIYLELFERKTFANANLIHYTSVEESLKSYFYDFNDKKIVIFNAVDFKKYLQNKSTKLPNYYSNLNEKKIVLFLGRINYIKGLDKLIKSWEEVAHSIPDAHLVIAGPDNHGYKEILQDEIEKLKIEKSITFTGNLNLDDKIKFLRNSKMLICTSYLESFGMSIAEAMVFKKPVIVSNKVNIHPLIKKYNAGLIVDHNEKNISLAIANLLNDSSLIEKQGKNGYKLVTENFSLDKISKQMILTYKNISVEN